jgi:hypothetical protein
MAIFHTARKALSQGGAIQRDQPGRFQARLLTAGVRAENSATLCDLGVFMDQPAKPISPDDLGVGVNRVR